MEDYLKGWKDRKEVYIPPVLHRGFQQEVIIRKSVEPIHFVQEEQGESKNLLETIETE